MHHWCLVASAFFVLRTVGSHSAALSQMIAWQSGTRPTFSSQPVGWELPTLVLDPRPDPVSEFDRKQVQDQVLAAVAAVHERQMSYGEAVKKGHRVAQDAH
jgi:hypothetical protein